MRDIKIVWVGCHEEGVSAYRSILEKGYTVTKFITLDDDAFKKRSAGTREYAELCKKHCVPIGLISTIKGDDAYEMLKSEEPDLLIVLGWSEILPERLLEIPTIGTVGAHAAMLPHNRGSAPINWALIKGETECGNSLMWLDKEVDKGNIIDQIAFKINLYDTCKTLYDKVAETNEIMLLRLVDRLSNNKGTVMDKENVTDEPLLPRRRPKDGLLNWNQSAKQVYDFIRALAKPYPGAFTYLDGKKYFVWLAALIPGDCSGVPGTILGSVYSPLSAACSVQVQCLNGSILILELEDETGLVYKGRDLSELNLKGIFTGDTI